MLAFSIIPLMSKYIIHGGKSLAGDVVINGAKNAALGIVAASIMSDEMVTIENLPDGVGPDTIDINSWDDSFSWYQGNGWKW